MEAPAPKSVLRGHESQVHVAAFVRNNQRLATGDADGFVVLWDIAIRRPRAVWRAHTSAILGIASWGKDKIITHGRDNRLVVWKITEDDEAALSTSLPLDKPTEPRPEPWVLHILQVNTMNFCAFSSCVTENHDELFLAVPNTLASESVDIYHLPSQTRRHTVHLTDQTREKTGMAMALALLQNQGRLTLVAGFENGMAVVARQFNQESWDVTYKTQAHSQPVLSLDISIHLDYFLTSGADALIVKHPIPTHTVTSQNKGKAPVQRDNPSPGHVPMTMKTPQAGEPSLLSAALAEEPKRPGVPQAQRSVTVETSPMKVLNTKHSGQQSLRMRSDGKIFATAGWDAKVRVYSAKTMAELAVLKWHDLGCYATAFASIVPTPSLAVAEDSDITLSSQSSLAGGESRAVQHSEKRDLNVKDKRVRHAKETHWLAVGSKDGKISLWDIY